MAVFLVVLGVEPGPDHEGAVVLVVARPEERKDAVQTIAVVAAAAEIEGKDIGAGVSLGAIARIQGKEHPRRHARAIDHDVWPEHARALAGALKGMVEVEQRHPAGLNGVAAVPEIGQDEAGLQIRTADPRRQRRGEQGGPAVATIVREGEESEAGFVLSVRPCPAAVVEEWEQGIGGFAAPTAVQVGSHHRRGAIRGVAAKSPEDGKENEVTVLAAAAPKQDWYDPRGGAGPVHV